MHQLFGAPRRAPAATVPAQFSKYPPPFLRSRVPRKFFADWDVIVTPPYGLLTTTNLTGHPQVVVPCGFVDGMPRGLSFIGNLYDEGSPLRVALAYEQATEWHTRRSRLA